MEPFSLGPTVEAAPWVNDLMPGTAQEFMYVVIEIAAGLIVLISSKWGSLMVAALLGEIIVNLLTIDPPRTTTSRRETSR